MAWGYRFRLPNILCSKVKAVSGHFIVLQNKVINFSQFTVPEGITARWEKLFCRPKMLSDDILSLLGESE